MPKKNNATRADGRIAVQIYLGRDENNKRLYKTVYGIKQSEADEKAKKIREDIKKGINYTADAETFRDWADIWLRLKETQVQRSRFTSCVCACNYLSEYLGEQAITKIKTADVQNVITNLAKYNPNTKQPSSIVTLRSILGVAKQVFQYAIDNRSLDYNPANAVRIPKAAEAKKKRALTVEEQGWIINLEHRARCAAMIMMYSGLRRGELIPLTWNDIDLDARTITVNKAVENNNNQFIVKSTAKTSKSLRTVTIPDVLVQFLQKEPKDNVLVCVNSQGKMHTDTSWRRMWNSYLADLNIRFGDFGTLRKKSGEPYKSKFDPEGVPFVITRLTAHYLRHTFATSLYLAGVDFMTARDQLGHSDIETTLAIYTHLDNIHKRRSMDKLDEYYENRNVNASQHASQN
jgi:integrase